MDEQICRALIIHQLLGTRISDTLTLKTDCLSMRNNRYFIRIDQVKSVTYEKAISEELAQLKQLIIQRNGMEKQLTFLQKKMIQLGLINIA